MGERALARLLVIVLPASLVLTWISKLLASDALRHDAIGALYAASDRAADLEEQSQRSIIHYVEQASSSSCSDEERRLLFRAGAKLSGTSSTSTLILNHGWGEAADCCQWKGVGCDASGAVQSLSLPKFGLRGTVPTELGGLLRLTSIDLNENPKLSGTIRERCHSAATERTRAATFPPCLPLCLILGAATPFESRAPGSWHAVQQRRPPFALLCLWRAAAFRHASCLPLRRTAATGA